MPRSEPVAASREAAAALRRKAAAVASHEESAQLPAALDMMLCTVAHQLSEARQPIERRLGRGPREEERS